MLPVEAAQRPFLPLTRRYRCPKADMAPGRSMAGLYRKRQNDDALALGPCFGFTCNFEQTVRQGDPGYASYPGISPDRVRGG